MFVDMGADPHTGIVLNMTGDLAIVFESPQSANPLMPCGDAALEWIDGLALGDRLSAIYVVSRNKRPPGKKKTTMAELRRGWLRCYNEVTVITPNVKRILLICQTELVRLLFPGVPPMDEVHGTLFTLPCGLEVVPTFHDRLAHIAPWMDSDARRFATLDKPAGPLPYVTNVMPPLSAATVIIDLETNYPENTHVTSMGLQWSDNDRSIVTGDFNRYWKRVADMMRSGTHVYMHNVQFDIKYATQEFRDVAVEKLSVHCTLVRARSAGEIVAGLKHLGNLYTNRPGNYAWHNGSKQHNFDDPAYVCEDIDVTWQLAKLWRDFNPLVVQLFDQVVIMAAEQTLVGSKINVGELQSTSDKLEQQERQLYGDLLEKYGIDCNKNADIATMLIGRGHKVPVKRDTGNYIVDEEVLEKFGYSDIVEWKKIQKLCSSFLNNMRKLLRDNGTLPHDQKMLNAKTGRSTMSNFNWQQAGREGPVRELLVSRFPGGKIWYIDLAQNEVRTAIYQSDDEAMCAWALAGDGHRATASAVLGKPGEEITKAERDDIKTLFFNMMYMGKAYTEFQKRAEKYIRGKFSRYFQWADAIGNQAVIDKQVTDAWGKVTNLLDKYAYEGKSAVKRAGGNAPTQGQASHFALWLTLRVWKKFKKLRMKSLVLMNIHDAMVGDCYPGEEELVARCVQEAFIELGTFLVKQFPLARVIPLEGELTFDSNWSLAVNQKGGIHCGTLNTVITVK